MTDKELVVKITHTITHLTEDGAEYTIFHKAQAFDDITRLVNSYYRRKLADKPEVEL